MLSLLPVLLLALARPAFSLTSCAAFDINWNLLVFGIDGKDYSAGAMSTWASGSPSDITASSRPPFDSANATCYLSQFTNAIYFLNVDQANPTDIYVYDATAKSWSSSAVSSGNFDPTNFKAILDHDTNIFYALSGGELYSLDMQLYTSVNSSLSLAWQDVSAPSFTTSGYDPVMALADNHVHFLDVPGLSDGEADIFVIHFSYWQPETQSFGSFPSAHGQAASIFLEETWQDQFVFVPDTFDGTYVIDVTVNTTTKLAAPSGATTDFGLFGTPSSIVLLTDSSISWIPFVNGTDSSSATWTEISSFTSLLASSSSSSSSSAVASGTASGSAKGSSSTSTSASASASSSSGSNAASGMQSGLSGLLAGVVLGSVGVMLL